MRKKAMASASPKTLLEFFQPSTKRLKATISSSPSSSSQTLKIPISPHTSFPCVSSSSNPANGIEASAGPRSPKQMKGDEVNSSRFLGEGEGTGCVKLEELLVEKTWIDVLSGEFRKPYGRNLCAFVEKEVSGSHPVYPPLHLVFNALNLTPLDRVKAVIIGQDPYHGPGQAMGLSFSVPEGIKAPSSLVNIFKELKQDIGCSIPSHGNLERWAAQGVLLLNTVLTVRSHQANSHAKKGWEPFTDAIIQTISQKRKGVVFLLWGNFAQGKSKLIDGRKHHILKAAHPSGLSANKGFFGCRHFSKANEILERIGHSPIDWQL